MSISVKCPTCKKDVIWAADSTYRPFCSKRCRLIDLGQWADESHRIPSESLVQNDDEIAHPYEVTIRPNTEQ